MLLSDLLSWWYVRGWQWAASHLLIRRNGHILEYFSISALLRTLFSPFRQDYIETKGAPVGLKLQAFGGNIISRFIGMLIRLTLVAFGLLTVAANTVLATAVVVVWPLLPVAPLVAIVFAVLGIGVRSV